MPVLFFFFPFSSPWLQKDQSYVWGTLFVSGLAPYFCWVVFDMRMDYVCRERFIKLVDQFEGSAIEWQEFEKEVRKIHISRTGAPHFREVGELPKLEENFYSNPYPGCICEKKPHSRRLLKRPWLGVCKQNKTIQTFANQVAYLRLYFIYPVR